MIKDKTLTKLSDAMLEKTKDLRYAEYLQCQAEQKRRKHKK